MTQITMELLPHQREALEFIEKANGRALNASDPGLGKTAVSIAYLEKHSMYPALVVSPASVTGAWQNEFTAWTGRESVILSGRTPRADPVDAPLTILNYNILSHQLPWLLEQDYKVIIFDEAHSLQSMETKWTQAAITLAKRCARIQGLSGTPVANRAKDFFPILHIIRPDMFPSFHRYAWTYCNPRFLDTQGRWDYTGASNLDQLHELIKPFTIRRKKEILNLPKQSIRMEIVSLDNEEVYRPLHKQYATCGFTTNKGSEKLTLMTKLLMTTARGKAKACVDWLCKALADNPKDKLIVFCTHTGMLDVIYRRVAPGQALKINGSVTSKKRTKVIAQFQSDENIRLIVCNIKAAGAGITLTAATKTIFVELPYAPRDILQAKDRNHRIGQTMTTEVIYLVAKDTIEERLCRILQEKSEHSDTIIDGGKQHNMNMLDMLSASMAEA